MVAKPADIAVIEICVVFTSAVSPAAAAAILYSVAAGLHQRLLHGPLAPVQCSAQCSAQCSVQCSAVQCSATCSAVQCSATCSAMHGAEDRIQQFVVNNRWT